MDRGARNDDGSAEGSPRWRSRLVRHLRRSHGTPGELLRHAGRVLQSRREADGSRGWLDARGVWRPAKCALFGHCRKRRVAEPKENQERCHHPSRGVIRYADAGPEGVRLQGQSRVRLGCGLAAPGAGRDAGTHRGLQTHHARGQQGRPQYRDRRSGWPRDVPGRRQAAI